ncbi:hypothetical protein Tco_0849402 [Tanacetum coccineum]
MCFDRLESLNMVFDAELSINIILSGLPADYNQFVLSYQMNKKETSIMELHSLLQTAEQRIKKSDVPSTSAAPVLTGHWKHSCPKYLKDLKDEKVKKGVHSGMYMIELHNTTTSDSWVLDTGCGTHICAILQGLKENHTCDKDWKVRAYAEDGYQFSFDNENGDISVYSNGCFMFKASPCKGIYETVECISNDGNMILNVGSSNELDKSKLTPPRTPELNGVAERRNKTLFDMKVPKIPFEMWKGKRPSLGHIKIWGCEVFVRREAQDKLEAISEKCLFVEDSGSKIDLEEIQEFADEEPIVNTDTQQEVVTLVEPDDISLPICRTSSRVSKPPQFYYGFHIEEDKISDSTLSELDEPTNYKEAIASPEAAK